MNMRLSVLKAQGIDIFHEVLFALSGTRSAFTSYQFAVKELFQLSEAVLLERILSLGQEYGKLKAFIDSVKSRQFEETHKVGLYLIAFAEFLNRALDPYWDDVVILEQEITNQVSCSLHFIWSKMHRHCELLSGLLSLVNSVVCHGSYGCVILQHLHQVLSSDVGVTRAAVAIIIDGMNEIFFRQISCWLLYGDLVDTQQEFFIIQSDAKKESTPFEMYKLNHVMLPYHIQISLAEKILVVGQTVLFLRSNPGNENTIKRDNERSEICIDRGGISGEKEKILQEKIGKVREICKWNENGKMEKVVAEISSYVTLQLWTLAVQDAKLIDQLHLINDFFLLARGELFHEFVRQADRYSSHSGAGKLDLNMLLRESARKVLMREESLQRLSLDFLEDDPESKALDDSEGEWNRVLVKYDAPWPLQLLFTDDALGSYNKIFRFLLRLKKIEVKLGEYWLFEKSKRFGQDNLKRRQLHRNLCFLINNLQYYFHVDVLNSQFVIFEEVVETSRDFERIQKAHAVFLQNLTSQLFLCADSGENTTKNPIKRSISNILALCEEFCEAGANAFEKPEDERLSCMLTRFEAFVEFLLNHLTRITSQAIHPSSQHLLQFLLRLDFNSFFSDQFSSSLASVYF